MKNNKTKLFYSRYLNTNQTNFAKNIFYKYSENLNNTLWIPYEFVETNANKIIWFKVEIINGKFKKWYLEVKKLAFCNKNILVDLSIAQHWFMYRWQNLHFFNNNTLS